MKPLDTEKEDSDDKLNEPLIKHFVEELDRLRRQELFTLLRLSEVEAPTATAGLI